MKNPRTGLSRRSILTAGAAALALPFAATAQSGPVSVVVPYAPGGATDYTGRLVAREMAARLNVPFVVDNRPGAGSLLGAEFVVRARPDGNTIGVMTGAATVLLPLVKSGLSYEPARDLVPVSLMQVTEQILVSRGDGPIDSFETMMKQARAKRDGVSFAHTGVGTANHFAGITLENMAKVKLVLVPYSKGEQQILLDLIGGQVDVAVISVFAALPHIKTGKVRPIAGLGPDRPVQLPDLRTVAEMGLPGFNAGNSFLGLHAPRGTPPEVIKRLAEAAAAAIRVPEVNQKIKEQGGRPVGSTPEEYSKFITAEQTQARQMMTQAGIKPE